MSTDIAAEIAAHRQLVRHCDHCETTDAVCEDCMEPWPCLVRRLAAELEQAEVALNVAEGRGWERCAQATNEAIDHLTAERDALRAAGTAMAEAIGVLLGGGVEMQPAPDGPMTFEAMLMLLQMLGVHRGQWRALIPATAAEGGEVRGHE